MHPVAYRLSLLTGVAISALLPAMAEANPIYSASIVSPAEPIGLIPDTVIVSLPAFNPTAYPGADLVGITLTVSAQGTGIFRVTNNDPANSYHFSSGGASGYILVADMADPALTVSDKISMSGVAGNAKPAISSLTPSTTYFPGQSISGTISYAVPTSKFAEFENPNPAVMLQFSSTVSNLLAQGQSNSRAGNLNLNYGATASITAMVSIEYKLPEPASMSVLGAGLVGMGVVRRRRRA